LESKIGIPPVTKDMFCNFVNTFDLKGFSGYIKWIAVKKTPAAGERSVCVIYIVPPYASNGGLVVGYAQAITNAERELLTPQTLVSIDELYTALFHSFILVCPVEREYLYLG
jgi:16S rRNA G966 N2-methylase RsmD